MARYKYPCHKTLNQLLCSPMILYIHERQPLICTPLSPPPPPSPSPARFGCEREKRRNCIFCLTFKYLFMPHYQNIHLLLTTIQLHTKLTPCVIKSTTIYEEMKIPGNCFHIFLQRCFTVALRLSACPLNET